jgi:hypothetical protein
MDKKQQEKQELEQAIQEFLAKGGTIKKIPEGVKSERIEIVSRFGRGRKKGSANK